MGFKDGYARSTLAKISISLGTLAGALVAGYFNLLTDTGNIYRENIMLVLSVSYAIRLTYDMFFFMQRKIGWFEGLFVTLGFSAMNQAYVTAAGGYVGELDLLDFSGIVLFVVGSWINFKAGYDRAIWKRNPSNKGRLYTQGLFKYSMHINYFGDALAYIGLAMISHNLMCWGIAALLVLNFVGLQIPMLDKHLGTKYGSAFEEHQINTSNFVPFTRSRR